MTAEGAIVCQKLSRYTLSNDFIPKNICPACQGDIQFNSIHDSHPRDDTSNVTVGGDIQFNSIQFNSIQFNSSQLKIRATGMIQAM